MKTNLIIMFGAAVGAAALSVFMFILMQQPYQALIGTAASILLYLCAVLFIRSLMPPGTMTYSVQLYCRSEDVPTFENLGLSRDPSAVCHGSVLMRGDVPSSDNQVEWIWSAARQDPDMVVFGEYLCHADVLGLRCRFAGSGGSALRWFGTYDEFLMSPFTGSGSPPEDEKDFNRFKDLMQDARRYLGLTSDCEEWYTMPDAQMIISDSPESVPAGLVTYHV